MVTTAPAIRIAVASSIEISTVLAASLILTCLGIGFGVVSVLSVFLALSICHREAFKR
jgi:hypothetical protein